MKKVFSFLLVLLSGYVAYSQSISHEGVFASTDNRSNDYAQISWTLGDIRTQTRATTNPKIIITQGFLQSDLKKGVDVVNIDNESFDLLVYPNPVSEILNIKLQSGKGASIQLYLYNLEGKLISSMKLDSLQQEDEYDFKQLQNGTYLLKAVSSDNSFIKTYKILYQN